MSLQFVIGSSGAGKSHTVYEEMIRDALEHSERTYLVIVPDQFTMQTQKAIAGMHPGHGLLNIDVLSFSRLAWRVFEETGGDNRPVLDDAGKSLVLQRVIARRKKELRVLGGTLARAGSVSQMKSLVSELLQYRIRPEDLADLNGLPSGHTYLEAKLEDVRTVYGGFLDYLRERYLTTEEVPELLCRVIGESSLVRGSTVILDGFTGFTPVQYEVVRELLRLCRKVTVTVTMDSREDPARDRGIHELFHMSRDMIRRITRLAGETRTELLPLLRVDGRRCGRHAGKGALQFLERNLFRYERAVFDGPTERITLLEAESPRREILAAAEKIKRMVREEGLHYRDFAVLTGDLDSYGREAERIFTAEGIPFFLDQKKTVMGSQAVEFVRAAMDMIVQRYSYESVFRLLRTGLSGFTREETDILENYVLALGIRGRKMYGETWVRKPRTDREDRLLVYNALRQRFLELTEDLHAGMHERGSSARRKAEVLYAFLVRCGLQEKCAAAADRFAAEGRLSLSREYARIWQTICDLLDRLVEVLGDEQMGLEAFQDVLDAGLAECSIGLVPPGEDQIMVGDIERTRLKDIRVLFFAGVNDGIVPSPVRSGGILSDADRECLRDASMELAPTEREEICRQRFYLYLCLTRPSELLVMSWARTDTEGRALLPSWLAGMIRKMFPAVPVLADERNPDVTLRMETEEGRREILIRSLQNRQGGIPDAAVRAMTLWQVRSEQGAAWLGSLLEASGMDGRQEGLGQVLAAQLYGRLLMNSASRLEDFASCACRHFLDYGLRLTEREEYGFTPADFGTVMHAALERFARGLRRDQLDWASLEDDRREMLADLALDEVAQDYNNTVLQSTGRHVFLLHRIREMLRRTVWALQEQLKRGDFRPSDFEFAFSDDLEALHFRLPGGTAMQLRGRIDRVDELAADGTRFIKIIDYKTGSTSLDLDGLWNGTQLQLAVYMNAALESESRRHPGETAEPAGIFYYHIDDPFLTELKGEKETGETEDREALLARCREELLKKLKPDGLVRSEPDILRHLDHTLTQGSSSVLPVSLNRDGSLRKNARAADGEVFRLLQAFARIKAGELGCRIMEGETAAEPVRDGDISACDWCPYRGICGFDEKLEGFRYRHLVRDPDVLKKMKERLEDGSNLDR